MLCMYTCTHTHTGLVTWLLPCYIAGRNAEAVGGSCCLHCIAYYIPIVNIFALSHVRGKIREARGIAGSFWDDCLNVYFCEFCSLVQEARVSRH